MSKQFMKIQGNLHGILSSTPYNNGIEVFRAGPDMMYLISAVELDLPGQKLKSRPDPRRRWVGQWQRLETVEEWTGYIAALLAQPRPCPRCDKEPTVYEWAGGFLIFCHNSSHRRASTIMWRSYDSAIAEWNAGNVTA